MLHLGFERAEAAWLQVEQSRFLVPPFTLGESVFVGETRRQQHPVEPVQQGGTRSLLADFRYCLHPHSCQNKAQESLPARLFCSFSHWCNMTVTDSQSVCALIDTAVSGQVLLLSAFYLDMFVLAGNIYIWRAGPAGRNLHISRGVIP